VHWEDLEFAVVRVVRVRQEDQLVAGPPALLDYLPNPWDRGVAAR
jgi:hypothetical protein